MPKVPSLVKFPATKFADEYGLLCVGGELNSNTILSAYRQGVFPWPIIDEDEEYLAWFAPPERALLYTKDFVPSRTLQKERRRLAPEFVLNKNFPAVIENCSASANRQGQTGTWITRSMIDAYTKLNKEGAAHSVECYIAGELAGGLYGVNIGGMFAGESMFYLRPNASKLALWFLIDELSRRGAEWIDCQVMTPFFRSLGARKIKREKFEPLLQEALSKPALF